jgi:hypothetical protein
MPHESQQGQAVGRRTRGRVAPRASCSDTGRGVQVGTASVAPRVKPNKKHARRGTVARLCRWHALTRTAFVAQVHEVSWEHQEVAQQEAHQRRRRGGVGRILRVSRKSGLATDSRCASLAATHTTPTPAAPVVHTLSVWHPAGASPPRPPPLLHAAPMSVAARPTLSKPFCQAAPSPKRGRWR